MFWAGFFFAIMNVCVKLVSHLPTLEVVFFRSIISLIACLVLLKNQNIPIFGNNKPVLFLRGVAGCLGLIGSFYTLQHIPLASAVTINYLSPFFTAVLGIFIVKQGVSPIQFLYFALAIFGVWIMGDFDHRISTLDLTIGLGSAFFAGLAYNMIAKAKNDEHPLVIIFYFPLITLPITAIYSLFHWESPMGWDWLVLLAIGLLSQVAQYYMTKSYQSANIAKVSSINYLGIVYALGFGYIFFDEFLNTYSLLGIMIIFFAVFMNLRIKKPACSD